MKNIVYLEELEMKSMDLICYSDVNVNSKIDELESIIKEIKWEGKVHDVYLENYQKKINRLRRVNEKMKFFGEYLKFCSEHYGETQEKLNISWNEYLSKKTVINDELQ